MEKIKLEEYIKKHLQVCNAHRQKRKCAKHHYQLQIKRGWKIDPLRSGLEMTA